MKNINETKISKRVAHTLVVSLVVSLMLVGIAMGEIPRNGLVGEWHFDGDAKDSSDYGNDGKIFGATFVDGKFGKALSFNGVDNYVEIPTLEDPSTSDWTNEAWIKTTKNSAGVIIGKRHEETKKSLSLHIGWWAGGKKENGLSYFSDDESFYEVGAVGTANIANGVWHHIMGIRKGSHFYIYVDGNLEGHNNINIGNFALNDITSTNNWHIGHSGAWNVYFDGLIDEVHIYNRALSESEIKAIYEAGQITITSSPPGSEVLINGQSKGFAAPTLIVSGISPESYTIKCNLSGYQDYNTNIVLTPGSIANIDCALSAAPTPSPSPSPTPNPTSTPTPTPTPVTTTPVTTVTTTPVTTVTTMPVTTTPTKTTPTSNIRVQSGTTDIPTQPNRTKSANITGKIADAKTGDPVEGATVSIGNKSTLTNSNGEYDLTVEAGKQSMNVSKQGYEPLTRSVILSETGTMLDLSLKSTSGETGKSVNLSLILVVLILMIAAIVVYFLWKKKKSPIDPKKTVESKKNGLKTEEPKQKKKFCMFCHAPMPHDAEFCPKCGKKQDETKRFCMSCGALMPSVPELCGKCSKMPPSGEDTKTCKNCGEVIPVVAKFCSACGAGQPD